MKVMEEKKLHAKFSASGSERWINCPGSIALSAKAPAQVDSVYAKEGTDAHTVLEFVMKNRKVPSNKVVGALKRQWPMAMITHAIETAGNIYKLVPKDAELLCETRVDLEFVDEGMFGTVDAAIVELFGTLWVIDYKYGAGRLVDPKENTQMIYYALGIAHKFHFNFADVVLAIAQPRIVHRDGFFRTWRMEVTELMAYESFFKKKVAAAKSPNAPLKAGRWCFFCPAQSICPAVNASQFEEAQRDFDDEVNQVFDDVGFELEQL